MRGTEVPCAAYSMRCHLDTACSASAIYLEPMYGPRTRTNTVSNYCSMGRTCRPHVRTAAMVCTCYAVVQHSTAVYFTTLPFLSFLRQQRQDCPSLFLSALSSWATPRCGFPYSTACTPRFRSTPQIRFTRASCRMGPRRWSGRGARTSLFRGLNLLSP